MKKARQSRSRKGRGKPAVATPANPNAEPFAETLGASIYDVAEHAGVSIVTVSRVFNDYPHVSSSMRERVFEAARQIGYRPRLTSKRAVIAILTDRFSHIIGSSRHSCILLHIIRAAAARGYLVEFIPLSSPELATKHLVNGLIAVCVPTRSLQQLPDLPPVPRIAVNQPGLDSGWSTIDIDFEHEGSLAATHLLEKGHRRLVIVIGSADSTCDASRVAAIRAAVSRVPDAKPPVVLLTDGRSPTDLARQLVESNCTAALLFCERTSLRVANEVQRAFGKRVPQDLSIISVEDDPATSIMRPALTTLAAPLEELADYAVEMLLRQVEQDLPCKLSMKLRSALVERESVAPPGG